MCSLVFYNELRQALASPNGFRPTGSLLSMIEEDIESLDAIITMAQSQERIANDVLSVSLDLRPRSGSWLILNDALFFFCSSLESSCRRWKSSQCE